MRAVFPAMHAVAQLRMVRVDYGLGGPSYDCDARYGLTISSRYTPEMSVSDHSPALSGGSQGDTSSAANAVGDAAAPRWHISRLSLGGQLTIFNMATSSIALLLACVALFAYDSASARKALLTDAGTLAVVIAENSTAAVAFEDVKAATGLLRSAALNPHV